MNLPKIGAIAAEFSLPNQDGEKTELETFKDCYLLLWWYPMADTPGWTVEGKGFRDRIQEYEEKNIVVLGISADPIEANLKFKEKYEFPFDLLSDVDLTVSAAYGACNPGDQRTKRVSVLIGPKREVVATFSDVNPKTHANEVLEVFSQLGR